MGNNISFYFWAVGQTQVFKVVASNSCGTTTYQFGFKSIDCSGGGGGCDYYQVSPNPASGTIYIMVPDIPPPCESLMSKQGPKSSGKNLSIRTVRIFNNSGALKRQQQFGTNTKNAQINLATVLPGTYIVEISDGSYKETHQLIIVN